MGLHIRHSLCKCSPFDCGVIPAEASCALNYLRWLLCSLKEHVSILTLPHKIRMCMYNKSCKYISI